MAQTGQNYRLMVYQACRNFLWRGDVPGYALLPWHTRSYLDCKALMLFLFSGECLRLFLYLTVWLLVAQILIWSRDLHGPAAAVPGLSAAIWVWPWLASARCRLISKLLGYRWPD